MKSCFAILGLLLFLSAKSTLFARPEYMSESRLSCAACHVQPFGGGQRNSTIGKAFGLHSWEQGPVPLLPVSLDFRVLLGGNLGGNMRGQGGGAQQGQNNSDKGKRTGAMMSTIVSGNYKLAEIESGKELTIAGAYDLGQFIPGPRSLYLKYGPSVIGTYSPYIIGGRFRVPFGLMTDEHRTFARLLTKTTNRDFGTGLGIQGEAAYGFMYGATLIKEVPGNQIAGNEPLKSGIVGDLKWVSNSLPIIIGSSLLSYIPRSADISSMNAKSFYFGLNLNGLSQGYLAGDMMLEKFQAEGLNNHKINEYLVRNFVPIGLNNTLNSFDETRSEGYLGLIKIAVTPIIKLVYKYDYATISYQKGATPYIRSGYGVDVHFYHTNLSLRYDRGISKGPTFAEKTAATPGQTVSTVDMFYAMIQAWI